MFYINSRDNKSHRRSETSQRYLYLKETYSFPFDDYLAYYRLDYKDYILQKVDNTAYFLKKMYNRRRGSYFC